jgi:membrane protease YdiL (CAAX protease family)
VTEPSRASYDDAAARPWWRRADTPVPGGVPDLARSLLWAELAIVLLVSLGRSAVYSVVNLVAALTAPGPLSAQAANLNNSLAPERPWLDLTYQLLRIGFALVPVGLAAYLLVRSGTRLREVWARDGGWASWRDLGRGAWLALAVGSVGVVFYLATFALGTNLTVVAQSLPGEWWQVPVLVLAALENALLEELVVLGFVQVRLRQLGFGDPAAIGMAAVLRGSYHLYQGLGGFVGNLAMGLLFGWLYSRWGRVGPFVVAHTLLDVGAFVGYAVLAGRVDWLPTL